MHRDLEKSVKFFSIFSWFFFKKRSLQFPLRKSNQPRNYLFQVSSFSSWENWAQQTSFLKTGSHLKISWKFIIWSVLISRNSTGSFVYHNATIHYFTLVKFEGLFICIHYSEFKDKRLKIVPTKLLESRMMMEKNPFNSFAFNSSIQFK